MNAMYLYSDTTWTTLHFFFFKSSYCNNVLHINAAPKRSFIFVEANHIQLKKYSHKLLLLIV